VVLLLLLTDSEEGGGGTVMIPGSHLMVAKKLRTEEAHAR
jgi:ectoine hydroxylase-related dioxygenase (phytanoyl-CoA dioxygenase family)